MSNRHMACCLAEAHRIVADRASDLSFQEAVQQASAQARASYAPYSRCPAGLALITASQTIYAGPYVESAAYNPSLSPLQSAIIVGVIDSMPCYTHVSNLLRARSASVGKLLFACMAHFPRHCFHHPSRLYKLCSVCMLIHVLALCPCVSSWRDIMSRQSIQTLQHKAGIRDPFVVCYAGRRGGAC